MKKSFTLFLVMILIISLCACDNSQLPHDDNQQSQGNDCQQSQNGNEDQINNNDLPKPDTNLEFCKNELIEVLNLFEDVDGFCIRHRFSETENKVVNTITINGQVYAYGNLIRFKNDIEKKRLVKRYAKLSLYKALSKNLSVELPWGALTGIRPTKLAYQHMETDVDFKSFFTDVMKVSEDKTKLTKMVIDSQKDIYIKDDANTDFFVFTIF